jgi:hypothetical protein
MPKKPPRHTVYCPLKLDDGKVCDEPRETAAMQGTTLRCPGCGGHYRAPKRPDQAKADGLPTAVPAGDDGGTSPPPPDPQTRSRESGRRGGRAAARIGGRRG